MWGKNKKLAWAIGLFFLTMLISYLSQRFPHGVERVYSRGFYRIVSQMISSLTGLLPISVAEFIVIIAFIFFLSASIKFVYILIKNPKERIIFIKRQLTRLAVFMSIMYFSFTVLWGINYHRLSFASIAGIEMAPAHIHQLEALCEKLIYQANYLRQYVEEDSNGVMYFPKGVADVFRRSELGFKEAAKIFPELGGRYGRPKGIIFSKGMSYKKIAGIYFPFTGEANVNVLGPPALIPSTATHEMAHQRGFAREDEANFIAYITTILHPDYDFKYSGTLLALIYSMNALRRQDINRFNRLLELYGEGLKRDIAAINQHSQRYEGIVSRTSNRVNNAYLQVNAQKDGVKSYGRMVDLLIAHYREAISYPEADSH